MMFDDGDLLINTRWYCVTCSYWILIFFSLLLNFYFDFIFSYMNIFSVLWFFFFLCILDFFLFSDFSIFENRFRRKKEEQQQNSTKINYNQWINCVHTRNFMIILALVEFYFSFFWSDSHNEQDFLRIVVISFFYLPEFFTADCWAY